MKKLNWRSLPVMIYTDGSSHNRIGSGGWGYCVIEANREVRSNSGAAWDTTNNRMELEAIRHALVEVVATSYPDQKVVIVTDSQTSIAVCTRILDKRDIGLEELRYPNKDIVEKIVDALCCYRQVKLQWTKGHAGHKWNERADELAGDARLRLELETA